MLVVPFVAPQGYEKFDPEVWLSLCDSGLSPMFTGGVWKWMPVHVLGHVDGRYVVEFKGTGKRKAVKRINLVFDLEDKVCLCGCSLCMHLCRLDLRRIPG